MRRKEENGEGCEGYLERVAELVGIEPVRDELHRLDGRHLCFHLANGALCGRFTSSRVSRGGQMAVDGRGGAEQ